MDFQLGLSGPVSFQFPLTQIVFARVRRVFHVLFFGLHPIASLICPNGVQSLSLSSPLLSQQA